MKNIFRWITAGVFLLLTALLVAAAKHLPDLVFSFYPDFSRAVLSAISKVSALCPVPVWELVLVGLIVGFLISLITSICKGHFLRWLSKLALFLSVMVFLFVGLWGLNYYAPPIQERLSLPDEQYTVSQLKEAACYYRDMANLTSQQVQRDEEGLFVSAPFGELAQAVGTSYETLSGRYDCFRGSTAPPKKLLSSPLLAKTGTTGIFICYTAESGVSSETYPVSLPFTMCHEVGHRMAFAREDEANFAAFLACMASDREDFRYSGYYNAFLYCYNALYKVDKEAAQEVLSGVCQTLKADLTQSTEHYAARRSETAAQVTDKVYDTYLKSFSVDEGVQSYGEVVDLLLIWYFEVLP